MAKPSLLPTTPICPAPIHSDSVCRAQKDFGKLMATGCILKVFPTPIIGMMPMSGSKNTTTRFGKNYTTTRFGKNLGMMPKGPATVEWTGLY